MRIKNNIEFGVIIPVYNQKDLLREALLSLEIQSKKDFITIVVDDNSDEDIQELCQDFSERINIVYIRHKENKGPGLARQTGLDFAYKNKIKYITFLDSDDLFLPMAVEKMYEIITTNKVPIATSALLYAGGEYTSGRVMSTWVFGKVYDVKFLFKNHIYFPKELVFNEDVFFSAAVDFHYQKDKNLIKTPFYYKRENQDSLINTKPKKDCTVTEGTFLQAVCLIIDYADQYNLKLENIDIINLLLLYNSYQILLLQEWEELPYYEEKLKSIFKRKDVLKKMEDYSIWKFIPEYIKPYEFVTQDKVVSNTGEFMLVFKETFAEWLEKFGIKITLEK